MKFIKIVIVFLLLISCKGNNQYEVKSLQVNGGWGYIIAINNRTIIKQTVIPTLSEKRSFNTEEDALKVGNLVLERIKQNLSPTIAKNDLILLEISK
ncbi:MAG: DUF4907 domain-containing protein [Flavobacterium sp.]|uniref:DUF4907 domain-containing protein n=1 Tax=Flavobacterium sp. TaxID=239 RepID=UPI002609C83D|nr:DUF4907 domain-containing protein [Flavobacterium sp.]MDD5149240.1 DUF4907 domain-containing protein [Flavobacterium sp.]